MSESSPIVLDVWGDLACFTRPDAGKVERFSYPTMTPSAARAVLDAVYWKPTFRWQVTRIEAGFVPQYISLMRNEVKDRANAEEMFRCSQEKTRIVPPLIADGTPDELGTDQKGRTQRQTMALKGVRYRIHAEPRLWKEDAGQRQAILAQFMRRAKSGACRWQPYLGCREFAAYFEPAQGAFPVAADFNENVGWMLYDVFDVGQNRQDNGGASISLFKAEIVGGVLEVPRYESPDVRKIPVAGGLN